jgi:hypothetical protein
MRRIVAIIITALALAAPAAAQTQIPQPVGQPVAFCGVQDDTPATDYQLVFDNREPETVIIVRPTDTAPTSSVAVVAFCNANAPKGWTHAFTVAASRFVLRPEPYQVRLNAINARGNTLGQIWTVSVGMKPGVFRITFVGQMPTPPQD